jgi:hypothetical protein
MPFFGVEAAHVNIHGLRINSEVRYDPFGVHEIHGLRMGNPRRRKKVG